MKPVFLDTGYLIALEASDDQDHAAAREPVEETTNPFYEKAALANAARLL